MGTALMDISAVYCCIPHFHGWCFVVRCYSTLCCIMQVDFEAA